MKRMILSMAAVAIAGGMMAQDNQLSFGVDLALPMGDFGDFASFGVGPAVGFEVPVGDVMAVTVQVSYEFLTPNSDFKDQIKSMSMLPAQVGLKYFFQDQQEGFYGHGQLGIHSMSTTSEEYTIPGIPGFSTTTTVPSETTSSTNFSWAIGVGYQMEKLDIGLRYNSISPDSDAPDGTNASSYIGIRAAYLLPIGG
jgi:outer membrane protein W